MSNKCFDRLNEKLASYEKKQPNDDKLDVEDYYDILLEERPKLEKLLKKFQSAILDYYKEETNAKD
jgi:hypothetical protein